jgi:uncharacterized damage-inducible protein DinB
LSRRTSMTTRRRPLHSEFASYAQAYIELVQGDDVVHALTTQGRSTAELISAMDPSSTHRDRYAAGKWTINEVLGHVVDTERIFAYRALCVARGESQALPGFDQEAYARLSGANDRLLGDLLDEFRIVRRSTIALFTGLPDNAWDRQGDVNGYTVTVRGLAFHIAGHELHHVKTVRGKYPRRTRP